jgi:hypothetical protein
MTKKTKIVIGVGVVLALGTVAFFGFRKNGWFRKKEDEENPFDTIGGGASSSGSSSGGSSSGGSSSGGSSTSSSKPNYRDHLKSKSDIISFQKFAKSRGANLGTYGPNGDGIDGDWGTLTQKAWDKWGASYLGNKAMLEYQASLNK